MFAICLVITKIALLLGVMLLGGKIAVYSAVFGFCMGLEEHPSNLARFNILVWGAAIVGLAMFFASLVAMVKVVFG